PPAPRAWWWRSARPIPRSLRPAPSRVRAARARGGASGAALRRLPAAAGRDRVRRREARPSNEGYGIAELSDLRTGQRHDVPHLEADAKRLDDAGAGREHGAGADLVRAHE